MRGIIFDLDGVLVDSMPSHVEAWKRAFRGIAGLEISEKEIYRLEGMRGAELITKIFVGKGVSDSSLADRVREEKDRIFRQAKSVKPFECALDIVEETTCPKAVVSGSSRRDVDSILDTTIGRNKFDVIITADDVEKGKPDPSAFLEAAKRMNVENHMTGVIENAPLGAQAANNAGMSCYITLNNTSLSRSDFDGIVPPERIFDATGSLKAILSQWCE